MLQRSISLEEQQQKIEEKNLRSEDVYVIQLIQHATFLYNTQSYTPAALACKRGLQRLDILPKTSYSRVIEFDLQRLLADCLRCMKQYREALLHYTQALSLIDETMRVSLRVKLLFDAGQTALEGSLSGQYQDGALLRYARHCLTWCLLDDPNHQEALGRLTRVCLDLGDYTAALEAARQSIEVLKTNSQLVPARLRWLELKLSEFLSQLPTTNRQSSDDNTNVSAWEPFSEDETLSFDKAFTSARSRRIRRFQHEHQKYQYICNDIIEKLFKTPEGAVYEITSRKSLELNFLKALVDSIHHPLEIVEAFLILYNQLIPPLLAQGFSIQECARTILKYNITSTEVDSIDINHCDDDDDDHHHIRPSINTTPVWDKLMSSITQTAQTALIAALDKHKRTFPSELSQSLSKDFQEEQRHSHNQSLRSRQRSNSRSVPQTSHNIKTSVVTAETNIPSCFKPFFSGLSSEPLTIHSLLKMYGRLFQTSTHADLITLFNKYNVAPNDFDPLRNVDISKGLSSQLISVKTFGEACIMVLMFALKPYDSLKETTYKGQPHDDNLIGLSESVATLIELVLRIRCVTLYDALYICERLLIHWPQLPLISLRALWATLAYINSEITTITSENSIIATRWLWHNARLLLLLTSTRTTKVHNNNHSSTAAASVKIQKQRQLAKTFLIQCRECVITQNPSPFFPSLEGIDAVLDALDREVKLAEPLCFNDTMFLPKDFDKHDTTGLEELITSKEIINQDFSVQNDQQKNLIAEADVNASFFDKAFHLCEFSEYIFQKKFLEIKKTSTIQHHHGRSIRSNLKSRSQDIEILSKSALHLLKYLTLLYSNRCIKTRNTSLMECNIITSFSKMNHHCYESIPPFLKDEEKLIDSLLITLANTLVLLTTDTLHSSNLIQYNEILSSLLSGLVIFLSCLNTTTVSGSSSLSNTHDNTSLTSHMKYNDEQKKEGLIYHHCSEKPTILRNILLPDWDVTIRHKKDDLLPLLHHNDTEISTRTKYDDPEQQHQHQHHLDDDASSSQRGHSPSAQSSTLSDTRSDSDEEEELYRKDLLGSSPTLYYINEMDDDKSTVTDSMDYFEQPPKLSICFRASIQKLITALSILVIKYLDLLKRESNKKSQHDESTTSSSSSTLILHDHILSQLRFSLQCLLILFISPIHHLSHFNIKTLSLKEETQWTSFFTEPHNFSTIINPYTSTDLEKFDSIITIYDYISNVMNLIRDILVYETTHMASSYNNKLNSSINFLEEKKKDLETTSFPPRNVYGAESLLITSDLEHLPNWIKLRFRESGVLQKYFPFIDSRLTLPPGIATLSIPLLILSQLLHINGIVCLKRWKCFMISMLHSMALAILKGKSDNIHKINGMDKEINSNEVIKDQKIETTILSYLPPYIRHTFTDCSFLLFDPSLFHSFKDNVHDNNNNSSEIVTLFGCMPLTWSLDMATSEVACIAMLRLFGLPIYPRSGPPFESCRTMTADDFDSLIDALSRENDNTRRHLLSKPLPFQSYSLASLTLSYRLSIKMQQWFSSSTSKRKPTISKVLRSAISEALETSIFFDSNIDDSGTSITTTTTIENESNSPKKTVAATFWNVVCDPLIITPLIERLENEEEIDDSASNSTIQTSQILKVEVRGLKEAINISCIQNGYPLLETYGSTSLESLFSIKKKTPYPISIEDILKGIFLTLDDIHFLVTELFTFNGRTRLSTEDLPFNNHNMANESAIVWYPFDNKKKCFSWKVLTEIEDYKLGCISILNETFYSFLHPQLSTFSCCQLAYIFLSHVLPKKFALFCPSPLDRTCYFDLLWGDLISLFLKDKFTTPYKGRTTSVSSYRSSAINTSIGSGAIYSSTYLQPSELINNLGNANRSGALGFLKLRTIGSAAYCHRLLYMILEDRASAENSWNNTTFPIMPTNKDCNCSVVEFPAQVDILHITHRTGVQALFNLELELQLLLKLIETKVHQIPAAMELPPTFKLCRNTMNSVKRESILFNAEIESLHNPLDSTTDYTINNSSMIKYLLSRNSAHYVSPSECLALIIRCHAEQLLTEFVLLKSLTPFPSGTIITEIARRRLLDPLFNNNVIQLEVPYIHEDSCLLQSHLERLRACKANAFRFNEESLYLTNCILAQHTTTASLETFIDSVTQMWSNVHSSPASTQLFRGSLWVPLYIVAQCATAEMTTLLWRHPIKNNITSNTQSENLCKDTIKSVEIVLDDDDEEEEEEEKKKVEDMSINFNCQDNDLFLNIMYLSYQALISLQLASTLAFMTTTNNITSLSQGYLSTDNQNNNTKTISSKDMECITDHPKQQQQQQRKLSNEMMLNFVPNWNTLFQNPMMMSSASITVIYKPLMKLQRLRLKLLLISKLWSSYKFENLWILPGLFMFNSHDQSPSIIYNEYDTFVTSLLTNNNTSSLWKIHMQQFILSLQQKHYSVKPTYEEVLDDTEKAILLLSNKYGRQSSEAAGSLILRHIIMQNTTDAIKLLNNLTPRGMFLKTLRFDERQAPVSLPHVTLACFLVQQTLDARVRKTERFKYKLALYMIAILEMIIQKILKIINPIPNPLNNDDRHCNVSHLPNDLNIIQFVNPNAIPSFSKQQLLWHPAIPNLSTNENVFEGITKHSKQEFQDLFDITTLITTCLIAQAKLAKKHTGNISNNTTINIPPSSTNISESSSYSAYILQHRIIQALRHALLCVIYTIASYSHPLISHEFPTKINPLIDIQLFKVLWSCMPYMADHQKPLYSSWMLRIASSIFIPEFRSLPSCNPTTVTNPIALVSWMCDNNIRICAMFKVIVENNVCRVSELFDGVKQRLNEATLSLLMRTAAKDEKKMDRMKKRPRTAPEDDNEKLKRAQHEIPQSSL